MGRTSDIDRLYDLLDQLEEQTGGKRVLKNCDGYMDWPDRGVYFFFSPETTRASSDQLRLTRIGTHAVSEGSQTSLWNRLRTHRGAMRGTYEGGGNHRGSVFRKRVGEALIEREGLDSAYPEWGGGSSAGRDLRKEELEMERRVSAYIRELPFLWVEIDDEPGPESLRAVVERNAIALVSNFECESVDPRASDWLGRHSPVAEIRDSGLWNINHIDESYDPTFFDVLERRIDGTTAASEDASAPSSNQRSADDAITFEQAWAEITRFAEAEAYVSTLSRGNQNRIRHRDEVVEVQNLDTREWRKIPKDDFQFAFRTLREEDELTLDAIEPELAGRKSMTLAVLTNALELDHDSRPLRVYF